MRESFILIIVPLLVLAVRCSNVDGDSYNLYKDRMRARDKVTSEMLSDLTNLWDSYPMSQGFDYLNMPIWLPEYKKRSGNVVRKRVMEHLLRLERLKKRTSKAALSLMLQSKQDPDHLEEENSCFAGK